MMNTNTFRIMMLMFIAAVLMNAMNYFFCSMHSAHRPTPVRDIENKFILLENKGMRIPTSVTEEKQTESTLLDKLMGSGGPTFVLSSASEYDTTTDSLTTTSTFGTVRVESSSQFINNVQTG